MPQFVSGLFYALQVNARLAMTLLLLCAGSWMLVRLAVVLAQVQHHSAEAQLGRRFQQELRRRGLLADPQLGVDD